METHPLSSFAIVGLCVTSLFGALLIQSTASTPIVASLHQPLITFSVLCLYQLVSLLAHMLYRIMTKSSSPGMLRHAMQKLGVYSKPSAINLWIIGGFGLMALLLGRTSPVANGFSFLAWSPFLIPIYASQEPEYCNMKLHSIGLACYATVIVIIAMAFNARGMMLAGVATVLLVFLLLGMRSVKPFHVQMLVKLCLFGVLGGAFSMPLGNLVTAMVMARGDRNKSTAAEMISKSVENLQHPDKIKAYRIHALLADLHTAYDENYIANAMLQRFVITKFHDNAIYYAGMISGKGIDQLNKITGDFYWTVLPGPILNFFKVDVDKVGMQGTSMGDVLVNLAIGLPVGGEKTGSMFGQGWALYGVAFPFIYFIICLILFASIDIFAFQGANGQLEMTVIGMLNVWPHFLFGITNDSFSAMFMGVVRGIPQTVILYGVVFSMAKAISNKITGTPADNSPVLSQNKSLKS